MDRATKAIGMLQRATLAHSSAERNVRDTLRRLNFAIRGAGLVEEQDTPRLDLAVSAYRKAILSLDDEETILNLAGREYDRAMAELKVNAADELPTAT